MTHRMPAANRSTLPPAGHRWGRGAQSVVPYLASAARARPGALPEQYGEGENINNPVFRQMDIRLVWRDH